MTTRGECHVCGNFGFKDGGDGFFYCTVCSSQADDIFETGIDVDDIIGNKIYSQHNARSLPSTAPAAEDMSQFKETQSQRILLQDLGPDVDIDAGDGVGPTGPSDFGSHPESFSYDDYYTEIRSRYVLGFQIMTQLQCKALVEKFKVSPLIVGLLGPIWLRYLAVTRIMADDWALEVIHESESQYQGEGDSFHPPDTYTEEPHNIIGQRAVTLWYKSLRNSIPLSHSLAIIFLVCLLAREAILPTDILKWILEGKLPYFAAFVEIEKQLGPPSRACPINSSRMFRPRTTISAQKLEVLAGSIAQRINLELPPVNFYGIAARFLGQLSLPVESILQQACRIYEWSMSPELYVSANVKRLPTRICVMSILIVTIRILYDLNGLGKWEKSLASSMGPSSLAGENGKQPTDATNMTDDGVKDLSQYGSRLSGNASDDEEVELDAVKLLKILETKYADLRNKYDYSEDLRSYLQHCKDVVFAGSSGQSFEGFQEEQIIEDLWDFYCNEGTEYLEDQEMNSPQDSALHKKRSMDDTRDIPIQNKVCIYCKNHSSEDGLQYIMDENYYSSGFEHSSQEGPSSIESQRNKAIIELKLDMEENRFSYFPPRKVVKTSRYIYYTRKRIDGVYIYAAHADYYILLRACARVAQVDVRSLHLGVMDFEKRLKQLEGKIGKCLRQKVPSGCSGVSANEGE